MFHYGAVAHFDMEEASVDAERLAREFCDWGLRLTIEPPGRSVVVGDLS